MSSSKRQEQNRYIDSATGYAYPESYEFGNAPQLSTVWPASPVRDLPDWPADEKRNDGYVISPVSSPGLYTPAEGESWNYFDDSFKQDTQRNSLASPAAATSGTSMFSNSQPLAQSVWNPNWAQANSQAADMSYVPLSLIHDPLSQAKDDYNDETESPISPFSSTSAAITGEDSPQIGFKGAWGSSKESRRGSGSSKPGRKSSRIKEKDQKSSRKSSSSSTSKGHQLRSTKAGQKINYSEREENMNTESTKSSRSSHNMVEKQYRTRLNGQFSTLLDSLPPEVVGAEIEGYTRGDSAAEKKVSKAEVLFLAKRHIETLERDKMGLEEDNQALHDDVQRLRGAWVRMGGQVLP